MKDNQSLRNALIIAAVILGGILSFMVLTDLGDYFDNQYSYNITLTDTETKNGEIIIEGLFKLKGIKYQKNDDGQLQVRGKDEELFKDVLTLSDTYKNYEFIPKQKAQEMIDDLSEKQIKFATINFKEKDAVFLIWEEVASNK